MQRAVVALVLVLGLAGCGGDDGASTGSTTTDPPSSTASSTTPPSTAAATTATASAQAPTLPPGAERSDPPAVVHAFVTLDATTDCGDLQGRFDAAGDGFDRSEKGTDRSDQFLRLMNAADDRLRKVGCY